MEQPLPIACIAIIAVTAWCSYLGLRWPGFLEKYLFSPVAILRDRQYYRMVSSALVHVDVAHAAFNLITFYLFGRNIESQFGVPTLLAIYLSSIVGGSLLSLILHRHHEYSAVGASGGVCGVVFAHIFLLPNWGIQVFFIPITIPAWAYAVFFLILSFLGLRRQAGRIGHDAHIGGAIIGLLVTTAMYPWIVMTSPGLYAAVMGISLAILAYLYAFPLYLGRPDIFNWDYWASLVLRFRLKVQRRRAADDEQELDRLLRKISETGMDSLSGAERRRLDAISRRRQSR